MTELSRLVSPWLPHPWLSFVLLVVWLLLFNSVAPGHILLGATLGVVLPAFTRLFWPVAPDIRRWGPVFRLFPLYVWDVVVANVAVAVVVLRFWREPRPVWIVIPLEIRDPYAISVLGNMISMTPGTVTSKLTPDRRKMLVHVVDTADPAEEVRQIKERYEKPLKEIFEC